ncbi:YwbE family protein [bacterium]|nr:YwbE family protein [bacterium]
MSIPRDDIHVGDRVRVVTKADQKSGRLTDGVVAAILTRSATHPHGIKVRLENGAVGRVKAVAAGEQ